MDGVKVDVQGSSSMFGAGPQLSRKYHESLEASAVKSFPGNMMINCMVCAGVTSPICSSSATFACTYSVLTFSALNSPTM